jgi:hypothetical protein
MGRYYAITVGASTWNSQTVAGLDNPGALDIEFDVFEYAYGTPVSSNDGGNSTLTIHGVSLQDIQQAANFASGGANGLGQAINVQAGMSAGFPLAKPQQRGPILTGQVLQCWGNWIGTEMTLDFLVVPSVFTIASPGNFVFNWQKGTTLQSALTQTFSTAYAKITPAPSSVFRLSGTYAPQPNGHLGIYSTLPNFAKAVQSMTKAASPDGTGVHVGFVNGTNSILAYDVGATPTSPVQIAFTDLVGQPTYIDVNTVQLTTVLRADLAVGTYITMPTGLQYAPGTVTTAGSAFGSGISGPLQLKYRSSFQGTFLVTALRHIGSFRDPNGTSWVTVITCVPAPSSSTTAPYPGGVS